MPRDEFPQGVKTRLALRVNYLCSNPQCRAQTSGPRIDSEKSTNVGVAAHITAASEGGPRFDSCLQIGARRSIDNGIWLCQICAKLVDSDQNRFDTFLLREWKSEAESQAKEQLGVPSSRFCENPLLNSVHGRLNRQQNARFGFSFAYPSVWDRDDPVNCDGNSFRHPTDPRIEVRAWGSYAVVTRDLEAWIAWSIQNLEKEESFRLLSKVVSGRHVVDWGHGSRRKPLESREQIRGYRIVYQMQENGERFTYVQTFVQLDDTQFGVRCGAPSPLYSRYEDLFLIISHGFHILGRSAAPQARAFRIR